MKTIQLKNAKKGQSIQLPNDSEIYNIIKIGKGYDTGWKKVTYGDEDDEDFQKTFTGDGELEVTVVEG
jgi:hypothetical protein